MLKQLFARLRSRTITVNVTADDIRDGQRSHIRNCPVARALARVYPDQDITVGVRTAFGESVRILLPAAVVEWIAHYDHNYPIEPITFRAQVQPR